MTIELLPDGLMQRALPIAPSIRHGARIERDPSGLLRDLLPDRISVAGMSVADADFTRLHATERDQVAGAVAARQREFAAGRLLARACFERMTVFDSPLLNDRDRVPLWPKGIVGSIAHDTAHCVVAMAQAREFAAIGIDFEPLRPLDNQLASMVGNPAEHRRMHGLSARYGADTTLALFCIKEAVYKAVYPRSRIFLEFGDVVVAPDVVNSEDGFIASIAIASSGRRLDTLPLALRGRCGGNGVHFAAAVAIPAETVGVADDPSQDCAAQTVF